MSIEPKPSAPPLTLSPATGKLLAELSPKEREKAVKIAARLLAIKARKQANSKPR